MSFFQELPYPVYISNGAVLTSGKHSDLKPGQLALLNAESYSPIPSGANGIDNPRVVIASGSWHTKDSLTKFLGGLQQPVLTQEFLGKDVLEFHRSFPLDLKQDIIQIGWDGVNNCDSLTFESGKVYRFKVNVSGEDVFRTYSRPLYRYIQIQTECAANDNCTTGCDNIVDNKKYAAQLVDAINNDVELKYFVKAELVSSDFTATSPTHRIYQLQVCDNGDTFALAALQQAYPTKKIERVNRIDSVSFYQFCNLISDGAPASFTPTQPVYQAVCGACPTGYTTVAATDTYIIRRPVTPTTDLNDDTSKATYAATIVTAYSAISGSGKFLGLDDGVAIVQISVTAGTSVVTLNNTADIVTFSHTDVAKCTPPAGSSIAWSYVESRYRVIRHQYLTLPKTCGGANRLADVQAYYANNTEVSTNAVVLQAGTCADTYDIQQYSNECLKDNCLSPAVAKYNDLPSFEGIFWTSDAPCTIPTIPDPQPNLGVRVLGAYADTRFGNCSFEPTDYFSVRPLRIQIEQVIEDNTTCNVKPAKVTRIQFGQVSTQSGEWLVRQYIKASYYEAYGGFYHDPRTREVLDRELSQFIDRNKRYVVYYIVYKQDRFGANWDSQHTKDKYETLVAFPEGTDTSTFETVFGSYFSQFGVVLKDRGV